MEGGDLLFNGVEVGVTTVILLDVGMNFPVLGLLEFFDNEGVGVGVGLYVTKEPGGERLRDVVVVDARGCV